MSNIWFLRTDKDDLDEDLDISENNKFVYSAHGICGHEGSDKIQKHKSTIFPTLSISGQELRHLIYSIKQELIEDGYISIDDPGKQLCDLFVTYWISEMSIGDIIFVRNKNQEVFICMITGYISEEFFDKFGFFQRPVEILKKLSNDSLHEEERLNKIWHRTSGRRALERNRRSDVSAFVYSYLKYNISSIKYK